MRYFFARKESFWSNKREHLRGKAINLANRRLKKDNLHLTHVFCEEMNIQGANMNFMFDPASKLKTEDNRKTELDYK